jgi:hypothetical protein
MKKTAVKAFETLAATYPATQRHILNHCRENLKSRDLLLYDLIPAVVQ